MNVELVHISAGGKVDSKPLLPGVHLLGRDRDCGLRVPSGQVSRKHCAFEVSDHSVSVRDLGSSNGTWVNAERVDEAELSAGDLVAVGPVVFVVRVDGEPENIDPVLLYEQGRPRGEAARAESPAGPERPSVLDDEGPTDSDSLADSSVIEFDFDLNDDEDDQPPL